MLIFFKASRHRSVYFLKVGPALHTPLKLSHCFLYFLPMFRTDTHARFISMPSTIIYAMIYLY